MKEWLVCFVIGLFALYLCTSFAFWDFGFLSSLPKWGIGDRLTFIIFIMMVGAASDALSPLLEKFLVRKPRP